jgi:hypothetical protein
MPTSPGRRSGRRIDGSGGCRSDGEGPSHKSSAAGALPRPIRQPHRAIRRAEHLRDAQHVSAIPLWLRSRMLRGTRVERWGYQACTLRRYRPGCVRARSRTTPSRRGRAPLIAANLHAWSKLETADGGERCVVTGDHGYPRMEGIRCRESPGDKRINALIYVRQIGLSPRAAHRPQLEDRFATHPRALRCPAPRRSDSASGHLLGAAGAADGYLARQFRHHLVRDIREHAQPNVSMQITPRSRARSARRGQAAADGRSPRPRRQAGRT